MIVCVDGDDLPMAGRAGERQPKELVSRRSVDRVHPSLEGTCASSTNDPDSYGPLATDRATGLE
jgi:hypothetical protein